MSYTINDLRVVNRAIAAPQLIELYRAGRFPFDRLIKTYPLSAINEAVTDQHHGRCVKAVLLTQDGKE